MSFTISSNPNKPNRLVTEDGGARSNKDNDKRYHLDYAKWAVSQAQTPTYNEWLAKIKINKEFYQGKQWSFDEDIEAFLNDSTGQVKNRIKVIHNVIRPMVEQYRGNASILKVNATAKSISRNSVNRREMSLAEKLFKTNLGAEFPGLGAIMRSYDKSIGENEQETVQIHENLYVDMYVPQINNLMKYVKELNDFEADQIRLAQSLALTGLITEEMFFHGGHLRSRPIESEDFFWDTDARRYDLEDAAFKGYRHPMDASMVLERYQPTYEEGKAIENYASQSTNNSQVNDLSGEREFSSSRIPVYKVVWRDTQRIEYGYVEDEAGYPYLTKINHKEPWEDEPKYTDEDLITPPDTPKNRKLFKNGNKKRRLFLDCMRFCVFIPGEAIGYYDDNEKKQPHDIVLDYGLEEYQETEYYDISNVKYSIKNYTWGYVDGQVFSPVDDAINPQRLINRIMSVGEQLINNSGGQGVIIDEDAIDPDSQDRIYSDIQEGKPITVRTRGKGVPNTVGSYDATPGPGTYNMFNVIPTLKQMIQDTTGVNEALKGESTGSDQLVGVTQMLIQRGSLMQEPFYNAMTRIFIQMYQHIATVGKRFYIDNERELAIIAGDEGAEVLTLSKDLRNEDFRVFISRENDDAVLKSQANQMLMIFIQQGLIDDKSFANLYNRSTPDDVTMALRSQAGLRAEAARRAAKQGTNDANRAASEAEFLQERDRNDKINAQNQQAGLQEMNNAAKMDEMITKAVIDEDVQNRSMG